MRKLAYLLAATTLAALSFATLIGSAAAPRVPAEAVYSGANVTIPDGGTAYLPFTTLSNGTDLLNRTDPEQPTVLAAGTYAITVDVHASSILSPGGAANGTLNAGDWGGFPGFLVAGRNDFTVSATEILKAGDTISEYLLNQDGTSAQNYRISTAIIVRLYY